MKAMHMVTFVVVKAHPAYNVMLERTGLNVFKAIPSSCHLKLKFPTSHGRNPTCISKDS